MADAGACAKENGLMRIYVRVHVNQFANLYLRRRPTVSREKSLMSRRRQKKYREGDVAIRYARVNQSAGTFASFRELSHECSKRDDGCRW